MKPFSRDTSPEAHRVQIELYRQMSPARRLEIVARLNRSTRELATARLRAWYPDDTERQRFLRLASLRLGDELMREVYGWDPEVEGR